MTLDQSADRRSGGSETVTVTLDADRWDAVLFDLDGVITDTASVHADAWKQLFDDFLGARREPTDEDDRNEDHRNEDHRPFTHDDYLAHVDGKPRYDGVETFLASRGISLPRGEPSDPEDVETIHGLGNRKNRYFHDRLRRSGVAVFDSTVRLVHELRSAGVATAVFSASRNCKDVLEAAGLGDLFEVRVDGEVAARLDLAGKPDPAMLLEAARRLEVDPSRTVVVEDAQAGVEAGSRGGFGLVIGVNRSDPEHHQDQEEKLRSHGADVVVGDLAAVSLAIGGRRRLSDLPPAGDALEELVGRIEQRTPVVLLDFDGTVSPMLDEPDADEPEPADGARAALAALAAVCPVVVVSGREVAEVKRRVGIEGIWYAGSHGFELDGPHGEHHEHDQAREAPPDRGKGRALMWLLDRLAPDGDAVAIFVGDDLTDEDALEAVRDDGWGIVVRSGEQGDRETAAHSAVDGPDELVELLERITVILEQREPAS